MSRCDYDVVFYRVFCVTLLAVAFTFIVILTNVFVDIDGLLSNKKRYTQTSTPVPEAFVNYADNHVEDSKEQISNDYKKYDFEINPRFRTKRSIESESTFRAKSPRMKEMLTRRLASLLEELDEEEEKKQVNVEMTTIKEVAKVTKRVEDRTEGIRNEDLLHLAMHSILLQGLIGHMDLNDVYKKVLVDTFNNRINNIKYAQDTKLKVLESVVNSKEILKDIPEGTKRFNYNKENEFLEEMANWSKLKEQIARTTLSNEINTSNKNKTGKENKVLIKTVIEINEINTSKGPNRTLSKENIEGLIRLIYNGKLIKVNQLLEETKSPNFIKNNTNNEIEEVANAVVIKDNTKNIDSKITKMNGNNHKHTQSTFINQVLEEYFKKPKYKSNSAEVGNIKTQRLKRQIKMRYSDNNTLPKTKPVQGEVKNNEDDFYVEIETHFDGKGIKGEKKKKLLRNLIDKIQKAVNFDTEQKSDSDEPIKFKKRTQDPIYSQNKISLINKIAPSEPIEHRQLGPIGKTLETHENILDRAGDSWKKKFEGPNFLSVLKSMNSAEMNELIVDYESVLKNGISKRLQKPLNTESMTNDEDDSTTFSEPGNVNLFLKDIGGSGFSIGFNQYAGEPPDRESLKMFDGIENLIKEYHKRYDEADNISNEPVNYKENHLYKMDGKIANNNRVDSHKLYRRSISEIGSDYYNAYIYKTILKVDPSFHRYYLNIFKRGNHISSIRNNKNMKSGEKDYAFHMKSSLKDVPIVVDERIRNINKKLKPSEILTIANLIQRKRRSISVKKISNLKSKIKLNRYLNTKTMPNKKVFFNRKRNKRQVRNVRIAVRDRPQVLENGSDENIFFISRENSYSGKDRAISAVETVDTKTNIKRNEYIDEELPFDNIYRIQNPNDQTTLDDLYSAAQRSKGLMSKYPHIFLDKSSDSKEIYFDETQYNVNQRPYRIQASPKPEINNQEMKTTTEQYFATVLQDLVSKELVGAIMPKPSRPKYKITVKFLPKNKTSTNGFKEVHTSVNKSFDENGLRYYTLLNVSQISKIEKLNITDSKLDLEQPISKHHNDHFVDQQKQIKNLLKLQKKRVDLQLNGLLRESDHLEQMIESSKKYSIDKPLTLLDIYKYRDTENVVKAVDSVRMRQDNYSTELNPLKTLHTTSGTLTLSWPITEAPKIDKSVIFDTIKQNENITLEILKKIDKNTQIMQTLLKKISERIDLHKEEHTPIKSNTTKKAGIEVKLDLSKDWKVNQNPFFITNELKNDTIPFVYAYQQSIPLQSKTPQSLASIVYHGHIHTNPVQAVNKPTPKVEPKVINTDNSRRKFNESKFFLDEVDNFQVTPDNNVRVISANIKINTTNVI